MRVPASPLTLLLPLLLLGCSPAPAPDADVPRDAALAQALQGAWCVSDDGGKSCWAFDVFEAPSTVTACGAVNGRAFRLKARLTVTGRQTCFEITEAANAAATVGTRFCSTVLTLNDRLQRHRFEADGTVDTSYRVPRSSVQCPAMPAAAASGPGGTQPPRAARRQTPSSFTVTPLAV